jgi:hypothetical protein
MARSRVELFEEIRRDRRAEGLSIRELAEKHRVHRRTVWASYCSMVMYPGWAPGMNAIHSSRGSLVVIVLPPGSFRSRRRPKVNAPA